MLVEANERESPSEARFMRPFMLVSARPLVPLAPLNSSTTRFKSCIFIFYSEFLIVIGNGVYCLFAHSAGYRPFTELTLSSMWLIWVINCMTSPNPTSSRFLVCEEFYHSKNTKNKNTAVDIQAGHSRPLPEHFMWRLEPQNSCCWYSYC